MPLEFIVVAVAFFDRNWTQAMCQRFFIFEPVCTAILLAAASAVHVIRIRALYQDERHVISAMDILYGIQLAFTAVCCGSYRSVPLLSGQGCLPGPKYNWVVIYWIGPTFLYTVSFGLILKQSLETRDRLSHWQLILRDSLNLYAAIWFVNWGNILSWLIIKPTGDNDAIKTIVTSMAAVITTCMTSRIILSIPNVPAPRATSPEVKDRNSFASTSTSQNTPIGITDTPGSAIDINTNGEGSSSSHSATQRPSSVR